MEQQRLKNLAWGLPPLDEHGCASYDTIQTALLMDIRDELQRLNRTLECPNAQAIPGLLRKIEANTRKQRKKKAA